MTERTTRSPAETDERFPAPGWVVWTGAAITVTLWHVLIDAHIGLWGETSDEMSLLQAVNLAARSAVYGWWLLVMAVGVCGDRWALRSALLLASVYAFFLNGLAAFFAAPPPSDAFPYQDISHALSLVTGAVAALLIRDQVRYTAPGGRRYLFVVTIAVLVLAETTGAVTLFQTR